jgi:aspartate-semialdehyde dehydrogenase
MPQRIPVAVLAATGSVGQRFVQLLDQHPWFEVVSLTGSDRSIGQTYGAACHWILPEPMPTWARDLVVVPTTPEAIKADVAFSALPSDIAKEVEPTFARAGVGVCSNASAYRKDEDVPLLLPEVNPTHVSLIDIQQKNRSWTGFITTNPNCTSTGMTVALKSLMDAFGVKRVFAVSLQAVSGAGYPGVASMDILDNIIPFIDGEESKVEWEPRKMLGTYQNGAIHLANIAISAHTNRVAVSDAHVVCLSIELEKKASLQEVDHALANYQAPGDGHDLPSTPKPVIAVSTKKDRPQPRLDRLTGKGMTTVVGRVRTDPLFDIKMIVLSHNTIRGAAGGSIYNAELLVKTKYING